MALTNDEVAPKFAMIPREILKKIRQIEIRTNRIVRLEFERIDNDVPVRSVSGPDCRLTFVKGDGASLVVKRMHTLITTVDDLEKPVERQPCNLPDDILRYDYPPGKESK